MPEDFNFMTEEHRKVAATMCSSNSNPKMPDLPTSPPMEEEDDLVLAEEGRLSKQHRIV